MADAIIKILGMSCQHCAMRVQKAIEGLNGITSVNVTVGQAQVSFEESKLQKKDIEDAVVKAGYKVADWVED
jgi:copper chaperone CopZ